MYHLIKSDLSSLSRDSFMLSSSVKRPKNYRNVVPAWQKTLVEFLNMKGVKTTVEKTTRKNSRKPVAIKKKKGKSLQLIDLVDSLPDTCESYNIFVLVISVNTSDDGLIPCIIIVDKEKIQSIMNVNTNGFIKFEISEKKFSGKVAAISG